MCSNASPKSPQLEEEVPLNHTLDSGLEFVNLDNASVFAFSLYQANNVARFARRRACAMDVNTTLNWLYSLQVL